MIEYSDELYKQSMKIIGSLAMKIDRENFEDLVEVGKETFLRALKTFDEKKGASFITYLHTKVESAMKDELRKMSGSRRKESTLDLMKESELERYKDDITSPEEIIMAREQADLIRNKLKSLSSTHSKIIKLMYWNGMNLLEVASHLRMSEGRISQLHSEALKILKNEVGNER